MIRRALLIILSAFVIDVGATNCYSEQETVSVTVCGSSVGRGKTYSEAYSQAASDVPFNARVYQKGVIRAAIKTDNWTVTLLWRMI